MSKAGALLSALQDGSLPVSLTNPTISGGTATNLTLVSPIGVVLGGTSHILDVSDLSKKTVLDMTALTTATTRTLVIPAADTTLVGTDTAQTLTNKTLTAAVLGTGLTASGSASNDFSASTGTFKTSSGANQLTGAVTVSDATTPSITTAASSTNSGFLLLSGKTSGGIKILPKDASTNKLILTQATIASADRTLTLPDPGGSDTVVYNTLAATLASKTLTSPIIQTGLTASGSTDNDFSASTGAFLTSSGANTLSGAVSVTDAVTPSITLETGKTNTGFLLIKGKTSGGMKLIPTDAASHTLTITVPAIGTSDRTLTLPDPAGSDSVTYNTLASTLASKTLTAPIINGATAASGNFDLSGSTGTFKTSTGAVTIGTGAISISGAVTVAANKNLSCSAGTTAVDWSAGTGVFKSTTGANQLSGAVTVADATTPSITLAAGKTNSGYLLLNGKTDGGIKILPADTSTNNLILTQAVIATADRTVTIPDPGGSDSFTLNALTQTLTNKTLTAPVLSGTVSGTYTLGGTPTINSATLSSPTITSPTTTGTRYATTGSGGAGSVGSLCKVLTAIANNSATDMFTVTIPNVAAAAWIRLTIGGMTGAGDGGGAGDALDSAIYMIGISRQVGVATRAVISTKSVIGNSGAGATTTATVTATVTSMTGAIGAQQTFTIQVTIARNAGASTNHIAVAEAELANFLASGITIA